LAKSFTDAFEPGQYIAVDEMMIGYRGRSSIIQYIKAKPTQYGYKVCYIVRKYF
jgi:hypothetical protein